MKRKTIIATATIIVWISFVIVSGLIYYVNHNFPEGPTYETGEIVCLNDERGPCGPEFKEDVTNLDIPDWAKFFKKSEGELLWMGLVFLGIILPVYRPKKTNIK